MSMHRKPPSVAWAGKLAALGVVGALLSGCSSSSTYPFANGPGARESSPTRVGTTLSAVVLSVDAHPGDRVQLVGAEPVGHLDGAIVTFFVSRPQRQEDGTWLTGAKLEPLDNAVLTLQAGTPGPDAGGIVAQLTPSRPGRYELSGVRVRYRLNDGPEQTRETIDTIWWICADDPAPLSCPLPTPAIGGN